MSKFGPLLISLSGLIVTKDESQILASEYVGGVIFFRENIENASQLIKLIDTIKSINDKLLLFIDQEGGKVKRITFPPFDTFKSQYEYGRTNLKEYIQELCTTNLKLQEYGIHVNLAPTLDSFSPNCPVIGKLGRSFTNNLDELSHIARTIYKEQRKISMPTVAKHFPDHGNTVDDSHLTLPFDNRTHASINNHINIYSTMIKEDLLDIVMPAHVIYKDIDPKAPATLSKVIINDIIRKQLNFKKVIISDCITMDALKNIPLDHVINQALAIGFDIVTVSHQSTDTIKSLIKQVQMNSDAAKERLSKLWVKPKNINPRAEIISTELGSKKIIFGTNKAV